MIVRGKDFEDYRNKCKHLETISKIIERSQDVIHLKYCFDCGKELKRIVCSDYHKVIERYIDIESQKR